MNYYQQWLQLSLDYKPITKFITLNSSISYLKNTSGFPNRPAGRWTGIKAGLLYALKRCIHTILFKMIKLEEITSIPTFSSQLENKILYSNHSNDISVSYQSTYTLKYVIDGVKHYNYNDQNIAVSKNQYLILNNKNQITTEVKKGTKGLSLFLSAELINEISHFYTNGEHVPDFLEITQRESNFEIRHLLNKIAYLYENNMVDLTQQVDDLFIKVSELIVQEQASLNDSFVKLRIVKHDTKRELYKLVITTKEYLHDNLKENISLDTISRDIGISKYYLHRLFTEFNGNTPLGYLTKIRLEKAKNKLRTSKDPIFDIAIACGFESTAYFSNLFKKHTGRSPSEFRKAK